MRWAWEDVVLEALNRVPSLGWEDPLEREAATHSSILARELSRLYSPWGCKDLDVTERLSLSLIYILYYLEDRPYVSLGGLSLVKIIFNMMVNGIIYLIFLVIKDQWLTKF